jgi:hypothetical protein
MPYYFALLLVVMLSATVAPRPLIALQRALQPRQVAVEWLTAKSVADALRHLPPATVEQLRTLQKNATPRQEAIVNMVEPMMAPLVFSQLMGGTLTTAGSPVSTITVSGSQALHLRLLNVSITGDSATVPLRVRATADGAEEAGTIELRRVGGVWRIVAANLGSTIPLARFDSPNYLDVATALAIEGLERDRARSTEVMVAGRLRALISAQMVYSVYNGGFFAPPECLTDLAKCKPSFKLDSPPLDAGALDLRGYASRFHPGEKPSAAEIAAAKAVAQSLKSWAHVFSPADAGADVPAMCGDSTGRVCRLPVGRINVKGGICPAACADLK